jgi:HlyD family secretion protein
VIANDLSQMQVETRIDEADIGQMRSGLPVTFTVDAFPDREFKGQVAQVRLEPITDQNVVTYTTVIRTDNPDLRLRPGMTANVTVRIERREDVLRVPNAALRFRPPMTREGGGAQAAGMGGGGGDSGASRQRGPGGRAGRAAGDSTSRGGGMGQGGGAGMSDAQRAAWRERMGRATPEERQHMRDSMSTLWRGAGARPGAARGLGAKPEGGSDVTPPAEAPSYRPGTIFLLKDGKPDRTFVLTGISDGAFTEIRGDALKAGDLVVIGMDQGGRGASTNLQPPPGMGGFRGPGGGGGGGGRGR